MVLVPNVLGQVLGEKRRSALGELRPADQIFGASLVRSNHGPAARYGVRELINRFGSVVTTHLFL